MTGKLAQPTPPPRSRAGRPRSGGLATSKLARTVLCGLIAVAGASIAAEGETQVEEATEENAATDDGPADSHDVFLPTEEISEDFAVPFPVDI